MAKNFCLLYQYEHGYTSYTRVYFLRLPLPLRCGKSDWDKTTRTVSGGVAESAAVTTNGGE
jgi:hypothetical protein